MPTPWYQPAHPLPFHVPAAQWVPNAPYQVLPVCRCSSSMYVQNKLCHASTITMTCGWGPMDSSMSIDWRACVSEPSLISMLHSATGRTVPPPPPDGGGSGGGASDESGVAPTVKSSMFIPPVSKYSVICCVSAPSVTGTETIVQFCQPPVAGTPTVVQTL